MASDRLIKVEDTAHWYTQTGEPRYDATLRHARIEELLPGQSSVTKQLYNPGLQNWILEQHILAALTLPRYAGEPEDDFAKRVIIDANAHSDMAADTGHIVHELAANQMVGNPIRILNYDPKIGIAYRPLGQWIASAEATVVVEQCEWSLTHGHAGRVDVQGILGDSPKITLMDLKTQGVNKEYKRGPKDPTIVYPGYNDGRLPNFNIYDEWPMQLGSYVECMIDRSRRSREASKIDVTTLGDKEPQFRYMAPALEWEDFRVGSLMVSTNPEIPGIALKWWDIDEIHDAYVMGFLPLLKLWRWKNKFPLVRVGPDAGE